MRLTRFNRSARRRPYSGHVFCIFPCCRPAAGAARAPGPAAGGRYSPTTLARRKEPDVMKAEKTQATAAPAKGTANGGAAEPLVRQRGREIQAYGRVTRMPIGLDEKVRLASVTDLNQTLADTMTLRDLYKKH